jgi:Zn-finger nucleic acid-binding protein
MNCPKCSAEMAPFTTEGVELDFCEKCSGIWFDHGELAFYTETTEDVPSMEDAIANGDSTDSLCPRCEDIALVETAFIPGESLLVDICPGCRGVFLDRNELAKVQSMSVERDVLQKVGRSVSELQDKGYLIL